MSEPALESFSAAAVAFVSLFALTFAAAAVGGFASANASTFYQELTQPAWAPSPSVFGPVWSVLYSLIALAAFLVVRDIGWRPAMIPLAVYAGQLLLNAGWTWLFFKWHLGGAAFVEILVLAALIALNVLVFWRVQPLAGALLLPYLGWVSFAALLTWTLWRSNPNLL